MRKILFPLYALYQICFAWWIGLFLTGLASLLILVCGHYLKIKNGDYWPAVVWCRLMCILFLLPIKVKGRENIKKDQNYVYVANHQGMFDIFVMYGYVMKNFKWMMKDSLRKVPLLGIACYKTDHIFVNRTTPQKDLFRKAQKIMKSGKSMAIFAEGTRSNDGRLGRFKKGAFVVASLTRKPIVPTVIQGSYDTLPKGSIFVHWSPITLTFLPPIEAEGSGSEVVESLMTRTRSEIAKVLGEE